MSENSKCVLIVDDEELLRSSLAKFLERNGFKVEMASSGNEAFDVVQAKKIDLVLSDIRMPDGDGPWLLSLLKQKEGNTPGLMFITGYDDFDSDDLLKEGALYIFKKPVDRQEILSKVKEYFQIS